MWAASSFFLAARFAVWAATAEISGGRRQRSFVPLGDHLEIVHRLRALEDARERVVVGRRNRIEFVIVAARTAQRHAQERAPHGVELLVDDVHLHLHRIVLGEHLRTKGEEAGRNQPLGMFLVGAGRQQVTGNLFADKLVVGLVAVERVDDVVAVTKRVNVGQVSSCPFESA